MTPGRDILRRAWWVAGVSCLLFVWAAWHEWSYHIDHRHASGPSVVLAVMALAGALLAGAVSLALRDIYTVERLRRAVGPARSFAEAADAALADLPGDVRARTYRNIARLKLTAGEERGSVVPIRLAILKDLSAYPEARDATARYLTELGLG